MGKRETSASATKRRPTTFEGGKQTAAQKSAAQANLAKGRKRKEEQIRKAREEGAVPAGQRWAQLLSGQLTVRDLDDEEVRRGRVRGQDGGFSGRRPPVPSHLMVEFQRENLERTMGKFREAVPQAVLAIVEIMQDPDAKQADRLKAASLVVDRVFGKTPETIRIEGADQFADVVADSVGLKRDIPDDASGLVGSLDSDEGQA